MPGLQDGIGRDEHGQVTVKNPVVDAAKVRPSVLATDLLLGKDKRARRYIQAYREGQAASNASCQSG